MNTIYKCKLNSVLESTKEKMLKISILIEKNKKPIITNKNIFYQSSKRLKNSFLSLMASHSDLNLIDESQKFEKYDYPLKFEILKECKVTKARLSRLQLPHATLQTPQFMPVGTQGALKGILPEQIKDLNCNLILANTYHLGHRPVGKYFLFIIQINV